MASENGLETFDLAKKHKNEIKELQGKSIALRKGVPKGDKKRLKEIQAQIALLEKDLADKHEEELKSFAETLVISDACHDKLDLNENSTTNSKNDSTNETGLTTKVSKAQKRREKKANAQRKREEEISEAEVQNVNSDRQVEFRNIHAALEKRNLELKEIPSDGDCLYSAIDHQLSLSNQSSPIRGLKELRMRVADYMRNHPNDFLPFLTRPDCGDIMTPEHYEEYCHAIQFSPAWGGQLEIRAMSNLLHRPIEIIQSNSPTIVIGEEYPGDHLIVTYHRHAFGLGEHYNSVRPKSEKIDEFTTYS